MSKKNFLELVYKDEAVKAEFEREILNAVNDIAEKIAKAHGLDDFEELSEEELKAVAGGDAAEDLLRLLIELEKKKKRQNG